MQATADIVYDVLLSGAISLDNTGQRDKTFFMKKKNTPVYLPWPFGGLKNHCLTIRNPDMIYLLTMLLGLRMSRWTVLFSSVMPAKRTGPLL